MRKLAPMNVPLPLKNTVLLAALAAVLGHPVQAQTAAPATEPTLDIQRYTITGRLPLADAEVQRTLAPFVGPRRKLADIEAAAQALEKRLRETGQVFRRVYVPAQTPRDGEVRLEVLQFTLGEVDISGHRHFDEANIRASLPTLREGEPPEVERLGADVSASNTNPAKQISVTFRESKKPGAVDAVVRVKDAPPSSFIVATTLNEALKGDGPDNDILRVTAAWQHSNLFNRDHVATLTYTTDPRNVGSVKLFGAYYQVPFYGTGMTGSAFYAESDIDSGRVLQGINYFDISGSGRFYGGRVTKALTRWGTVQPTVGASFEDRLFRNSTTFNGVQLQPDVGSRQLALQAALRDEASWGTWNAGLEWAANVGGGSQNTEAAHAVNGGERDWRLWRYSADVTTPIADWQLAARVRGQATNSLLITGEQFGLGGSNSVRGFADRVVAGERGMQWNIEGTGPGLFGTAVRPVVFMDGGQVKSLSTGVKDGIAAVGAGIRWARPGWQLAADLARVVDDAGTSPDPAAVRLHLGLLARF